MSINLNQILSKLGVGSKETAYLSVTPGVGLELIQLDIPAKTVKNYSCRPLQYNESLKQIEDFEEFKEALLGVFDDAGLSHNCNIILNMPTIHFGTKELPLMLMDESVTEALTSEVEQAYIFKKSEPIVIWMDSPVAQSGDMRKLFYAAIQKEQVAAIEEVLVSIGASLAAVDTSLISIIRALSFGEQAEAQMKENVSWNLMIINNNGYVVCPMINNSIADYYEEPLPIRSFEGDEIYNAINSSAQITLMSYPANYLYIISETDSVSAELLAKKVQFDGTVKFLENNQYKKNEVIPADFSILRDVAAKITLEAIGIGAYFNVNLPMKFNFVSKNFVEGSAVNDDELVEIEFGDKVFEISPNSAKKVSMIVAAILAIPTIALATLIPMSLNNVNTKLYDIRSKSEAVEEEYKLYLEQNSLSGNFDVNMEIKKIVNANRTKLMSYSAMGESVPSNLWLTYYLAVDDGKIDIKGQATSVEDVYLFFKNMKDSLYSSKLRIHKLELITDSIEDMIAVSTNNSSVYSFEITNFTEEELNPESAAEDKNNKNKKQEKQGANEQAIQVAPAPPAGIELEPLDM